MWIVFLLICGQVKGIAAPERSGYPLAPRWAAGTEWLYRGSVKDEALGESTRLSAEYQLEIRVLVLDQRSGQAEVAVCTKLTQGDLQQRDRASVHLTLVTLDELGNITAVQPGESGRVRINGPSTFERGWLVPVPAKDVPAGHKWEIKGLGEPVRSFRLLAESNSSGGVVVMEQCSPDWQQPRGDSTGWQSKSTMTYSSKYRLPMKVECVMKKRAPAHREFTSQMKTEYELVSETQLDGPLFAARKNDIHHLRLYQEQLDVLAEKAGDREASEAYQRLSQQIERFGDSRGSTPYREAAATLLATAEMGRENKLPRKIEPAGFIEARELEKNRLMPEFTLPVLGGKASVSWKEFKGKFTLVAFIRAGSPASQQMEFALTGLLPQQAHSNVRCIYVVVNEPGAGWLEREKVPYVKGAEYAKAHGIHETPTVVMVDRQGMILEKLTGWGPEHAQKIASRLRAETIGMKK